MNKKIIISIYFLLSLTAGFAQQTTFEYADTEFKVGSTKLLRVYYDKMKLGPWDGGDLCMDSLVKFMNEHPTISIEIANHSDSRSSNDFNLTLSQKRSEAVKYFLEEAGIATDRIVAKGYGETMLIYSDEFIGKLETPEEKEKYHQFNRRTEVKIIKVAN